MQVPPAIAKIAPDGKLTPRQRRHFMIEMCLRRVRPGTGSSELFMRERTAMEAWPDLREILKGIPWVIIGAVATRAYMPERKTKAMDILVRYQDRDEVIERLERAGYRRISRLAVPGYLMRSPDGVDVDVLFGRYPWLEHALAHPQPDAAGYPAIGLPYLILLKLAANRGRDIGDMTTMLGLVSEAQLNEVRKLVARYAPEDKDDLESLIYLGEQEMQWPSDEDETA
ncbi:MAG: hypothetical protein ACRDH2_07035 [Anaerolineales bacterium]